MDKIVGAIDSGLGYIDKGIEYYNQISGYFGGGGSGSSFPPYSTPPYTPPSGSGSATSAGSEIETIGGINVSTLILLGLAVLLLKR